MALPTDSAAANPRAAAAPARHEHWRLFFALDPSPALRRRIATHAGTWRWNPGARISPADKLHLTLVFMAAVDPRGVPRLLRMGAQVAATAHGFVLHLDRATIWPKGIAHLAPTRPPQALLGLQDALLRGALATGVQADLRAWRPHLTLARNAATSEAPLHFEPLAWHTGSFSLQRSLPGVAGYEVLGRWSLGADR